MSNNTSIEVTSDFFVVATGERPRCLDIPGAKEFSITRSAVVIACLQAHVDGYPLNVICSFTYYSFYLAGYMVTLTAHVDGYPLNVICSFTYYSFYLAGYMVTLTAHVDGYPLNVICSFTYYSFYLAGYMVTLTAFCAFFWLIILWVESIISYLTSFPSFSKYAYFIMYNMFVCI